MTEVWMWSCCGEWYTGDSCETEKAAIIEAIAENSLEHGSVVFISKMKRIEPPAFENFMDVDSIIEDANQYLCDNSHIEDDMIEPNKEQQRSLELRLNDAFEQWVKQFPKMVLDRYEAIDPQKIEIDPEHLRWAADAGCFDV